MLGRRRSAIAALVNSITAPTAALTRINARWAALTAFSSDPIGGVVRTAILARKKRACFRRAIPQIGNRQLPAEDSVLGVATTSRVKSVAAF